MLLKETIPTIRKYITQEFLSDVFGCSRVTISRWYNSDLNALSYKTVSEVQKLEQSLKEFYKNFKDQI
jgi:transcriptional regulator with XRE-family HTH domain